MKLKLVCAQDPLALGISDAEGNWSLEKFTAHLKECDPCKQFVGLLVDELRPVVAPTLTHIKLSRTGDAPLAFVGVELAREEGLWYGGQQQNRWHELALYQTNAGKFVLAIAYRTQWQGEDQYDEVFVHERMRDIVLTLQHYDPLTRLIGFPARPEYRDRQEKLRYSVRVRFHSQVSALLRDVEGAEEIEE